MKSKYLAAALPLWIISLVSASAATSLSFYFGALRDSSGSLLPDNTLVVLIANSNSSQGDLPGGLTANEAASGLDPAISLEHFAGKSLDVGNTVNADKIFYIGSINGVASLGSDFAGTFGDSLVTIPYTGGLAVGQYFGLYWFPGLTMENNIVPSDSFEVGGFLNPDANYGDIGMFLPGDGLWNVVQVDDSTAAFEGGSSSISSPAFTAISTGSSTIPEPSSAIMLLAAGSVAICGRRRKRTRYSR